MSEYADWIQNHSALGTLFVQVGFLAVAVWFGRKFLISLRVSQDQMDALLRLSTPAVSNDASHSPRPTPYLLDGWPGPAQSGTPVLATPVTSQRENPLVIAWSAITGWLQAPISNRGVSPWQKAVRWLQTPAGS